MKQKNQIRILIALILIGGFYAYFEYLLMPQWQVLKHTSALFEERKAYLERLENTDLTSLEQKVTELTLEEVNLRNSLPKTLDKPDIMLTIYNLAKINGISPQTLTYEPIQDEGQFYTMGMNFACTGPLENVFALVEQFRQGPKYVFTLDTIDRKSVV